MRRRQNCSPTAPSTCCVGGIICVLWFGARLVVENKLSPGELSTFVIYAVYVGSNVGALAGVVSSLVQVCSSHQHYHSHAQVRTAFSHGCVALRVNKTAWESVLLSQCTQTQDWFPQAQQVSGWADSSWSFPPGPPFRPLRVRSRILCFSAYIR